jgi:hypothetical protein
MKRLSQEVFFGIPYGYPRLDKKDLMTLHVNLEMHLVKAAFQMGWLVGVVAFGPRHLAWLYLSWCRGIWSRHHIQY